MVVDCFETIPKILFSILFEYCRYKNSIHLLMHKPTYNNVYLGEYLPGFTELEVTYCYLVPLFICWWLLSNCLKIIPWIEYIQSVGIWIIFGQSIRHLVSYGRVRSTKPPCFQSTLMHRAPFLGNVFGPNVLEVSFQNSQRVDYLGFGVISLKWTTISSATVKNYNHRLVGWLQNHKLIFSLNHNTPILLFTSYHEIILKTDISCAVTIKVVSLL